MSESGFVGLDPDVTAGSAHRLAEAVESAGRFLDELNTADWVADVGALTGGVRSTAGELLEELQLTVAVLETTTALMLEADQGYFGGAVGLGSRLAGYAATLRASLADGRGSDGLGVEVRGYFEDELLRRAGIDPARIRDGGLSAEEVDELYGQLGDSFRGEQAALFRATMWELFGAAGIDGVSTRLALAVSVATLVRFGPKPNTAGRFWEALDGPTRNDLARKAPHLVVASVMSSGVLDVEQLTLLDTANAYGTFTSELAAEFELEVGVRVFRVELGANVSAVFTKLSDGSVMVEIGEGFKGGGGLGVGEVSATAGVYFERTQVLVFRDEARAVAAAQRLQAAVDEDVRRGMVPNLIDAGLDGAWWLSGVLSRVPVWGPRPGDHRSATATAIGELADEYLSEETVEQGVYAELEVEMEQLGLLDALDLEGEISVAGYRTTPREGAVERGVVLGGNVELDLHGGPKAASVDARLDVRIYEHGDGYEVSVRTVTSGGYGLGTYLDGGPASVRGVVEQADRVSVTATLPLNEETATVLGRVLPLPDGDASMHDIECLWAVADVEVVTEVGVAAEAEIDVGGQQRVGIAEAEYALDRATWETTEVFTKRPGGDWYSRVELDDDIERAREMIGP